jgi:hypothetical protein
MNIQFYAKSFIMGGVRDKVFFIPTVSYEGNIRSKWLGKNMALTIYFLKYYAGFQIRWGNGQ